MSVVLFILSCIIVFPILKVFTDWNYKQELKEKQNGTYLPSKYRAQRAGLRAKDKEYYYWEKKDREMRKRRTLAKQKKRQK